MRHMVKSRHYCYLCPKELFGKGGVKGEIRDGKGQKSIEQGQGEVVEMNKGKKEEVVGEGEMNRCGQ